MLPESHSIPPKQISCIDFVLHVVEAGVVTVGNDGITLLLELLQVVDYKASEEGGSVFECRFIDDDFRTFRLNALHHALYAALAEIVGVGLHRESEDADGHFFLRIAVVVVF